MKKGISLITLIITVIVIVILAAAIVLNLSDTNIIEEANNAVDVNNAKTNEEAFELYKADLFVEMDGELDFNNFSIEGEDLIYDTNGDGETTPNISKALDEVFPKPEIVESIDENGKLVQISGSGSEQTPSNPTIIVDNPTVATEHSTIDGNIATYSNPIIPKGFKPVSDGADWTDLANNYNKGLVIEDEIANQFVWIPVDSSIGIEYTKDFSYEGVQIGVTDAPIYEGTVDETSEDLDSDGIIDFEEYQINTYGGFYIARYEAGIDGDISANIDDHNTLANGSIKPVSKQGVAPWNYIHYSEAVVVAKSMYDTVEVKSGLVTGRMWDATMDFITQDLDNDSNPDYDVESDSSLWGNYYNSRSLAHVSGCGSLQVTGYSEYWKANNLYDIAGNEYEWISERKASLGCIFRGGGFFYIGDSYFASSRSDHADYSNRYITFRPALFIQPE